jgi:hypothetical protein
MLNMRIDRASGGFSKRRFGARSLNPVRSDPAVRLIAALQIGLPVAAGGGDVRVARAVPGAWG